MTWHATYQTVKDSICHPFDVEAWRHFDLTFFDFALEPHNVRRGLWIDNFAPHEQYGRTYSYWSVILIPYNLLSRMCMKSKYMFLPALFSGPPNRKHLINMYLKSLIEDLLKLWHVGVQA
ncbi:UNVERIFIED_CONTAM: hypothetical protein Slati_4427500 [Sesamum latifolium]|uniref:Uncharacterized protein n=1 Tax=Sesamum latifolium TaxID=2727402 RepID=A0AAW2SQ95_9LAMI